MFNGAKILECRERRHIGVYQLARSCGVTRATIHNWQSGWSEPRATQLFLLAMELRKPMGYFFTGEGKGRLK